VFKDHVSGLEFLRNGRELCEKGLRFDLRAYECRVFMDFRVVRDGADRAAGTGAEAEAGKASWAKLAAHLQGGGVPNIDDAARELAARPVREPFGELVNAGFFSWLLEKRVRGPEERLEGSAGEQAAEKAGKVARGVMRLAGMEESECEGDAGAAVAESVRRDFEAILQLPVFSRRFPGEGSAEYEEAVRYLLSELGEGGAAWTWLFCWAGLRALGSTKRIVEWRLGPIIAAAGRDMGLDGAAIDGWTGSLPALAPYWRWHEAGETPEEVVARLAEAMFAEADVQRAIEVNEYQGVRYFNKEAFEGLLWRLMAIAAVDIAADSERPADSVPAALVGAYRAVELLRDAEARSGYDFDAFIKLVTVT